MGTAAIAIGLDPLLAAFFYESPIANFFYKGLSSVKKANLGFLVSVKSSLNWEYCDSSNLLISSACCFCKYCCFSGQSEVGCVLSPQMEHTILTLFVL